ncbi:SpoIIE family protein phosphatase [Streptantibioticus parmotrematis]|uniref:PP2C family protein-serine/threonine phosphatase n=1 Tax=Streptantibioticus parmotrematis TaxID=2873249 RepID=UPI0033F2F426
MVPTQPRGAGVTAPTLRTELSVLLVEDDAGDALLVEELLADSGLPARLRWVRSLEDARAALREGVPHCVLLDLHLPDAHGTAALDSVLSQAAVAAVVVLTGLAGEQTGLAAVAAGAQDYLVKGRVDAELFRRTVQYAVQRKQTEQAAAALQAERMRAQENARLERGLLPVPLLRADPAVSVVARYRPGRATALLGGDFYDVVEADDGIVHAVIGDVSGHGPDEAALGVCLRIAWRTLVLSGISGQALMRQLERILIAERSGPEIFATVSSIALDCTNGSLSLLRAGHPGLLLRSAGEVELLDPPFGPALGLLSSSGDHWQPVPLKLPPGGAVALYTDGLFEGRLGGAGVARLGEDGLAELAARRAGLEGAAFVDALIADAEEATTTGDGFADDVAVVELRWEAL